MKTARRQGETVRIVIQTETERERERSRSANRQRGIGEKMGWRGRGQPREESRFVDVALNSSHPSDNTKGGNRLSG